MTSEPNAPKASAIYLYRQSDTNDVFHVVKVYVRLKILTDEGRSYANVSIPFDRNHQYIEGIKARTIRPDGSVLDFDGTVYEKPMLESKSVRVMSKTFTLNDVQAGSIIEYQYKLLSSGFYLESHWILSDDLFTKLAKFSLEPYRGYVLRASSPAGLPAGTEGPTFEHGVYHLTAHDVPAFVTEEFMLPADELKMRIDFAYRRDLTVDKDSTAFWRREGKIADRAVEDFADERRAMQAAVAQILLPGDTPEQKLRRLYARSQQIRNLSWEPPRSAQESERESSKDNHDVEDVWKHGYGDHHQISWLFLALARAAGFQADPVWVATRNRFLFNADMENPSQLNSSIVIVTLEGRELYLDPATPFTPFGELPWQETAVRGLRLDKEGGRWIDTPLPTAASSSLERNAALHLTPDGTLEGTVTFTYRGLEALVARLDMRNEDDTARRRFLEDRVKAELGSGGDVTLDSSPDWSSADDTLVAVFHLKVPGWATLSAQRAFIPMGVFIAANRHIFEHDVRVHSIYYHFPHQRNDDITIELPPTWQVSSLPKLHDADIKAAKYTWTAESTGTSLHIQRKFTINTLLLKPQFYGTLQGFYSAVRSGDDEQAVLSIPAIARSQ